MNMTTSDTLALTPAEREQYAADGFLIRRGVFDHGELEDLRDAVEQAAARADDAASHGSIYFLDGKRFVDLQHDNPQAGIPGPGHSTVQYETSEALRVLEPVHLFDARIDRLVDDPRLTMPMQDLVGARHLSLWTAKLNLKRAGEGSGFGWHQDSPYWIHDCGHVDQLPNVMLALDDESPANGCFQVIRGSHRQGILPGTADGTQLGGFFTDPGHFHVDDQVAMTVAAGALIFFSPHSVHGSGPNPSPLPRRALILTYQPGNQPLLKTGEVRNVAG